MIHYEYVNERGRHIAEKIKESMHPSSPWEGQEGIVFVGSLGICVRKILPLVKDKYTDPAVICIDSTGKYVIPVLSGHIGGANSLARRIADIIGGEAIITTQSDNMGLWALDTIAEQFGWKQSIHDRRAMNEIIASFVNGEPTALLIDTDDEGTRYLRDTLPSHATIVNNAGDMTSERFRLAIIVSYKHYDIPEGIRNIQFVPRCLRVGIGLAHQAQPAHGIIHDIFSAIDKAGIYRKSIDTFCTIDLKADEPVVKALQAEGYSFEFHTAEALAEVEVPNPSDTVTKHVGTPSVSEASALIESGTLILPKQKGSNWTVAIAICQPKSSFFNPPFHLTHHLTHREDRDGSAGIGGGHIEIVGAGPGDPELVSVRGKRFLQTADLILYAGSLVPKELTHYAKPGCVVRSSADMNLEEQFVLMKEHYAKGHLVVRLHTGDPCIYGAIQEQMAYFDKYNMSYHITPGISSFLAAAAELRSQFTIPEECQTIILTRGEGRTPMPPKEKLHMLAAHQSTMCIFLSASIVEEVQRQLLEGGYPPETPVAACYKLTWKDQRIYRGQLKDLTRILKDNNLTLTTMIVVGNAIDNRHGLSKLYDGHFTHMFREAKP